jgi:hypothetical protein
MSRWHGLKSLLEDVVENGSRAVERVHRESARRPFEILELIPPIALPVRGVRLIHDAVLTTVYEGIRLTTRALRAVTSVDPLDSRRDSG